MTSSAVCSGKGTGSLRKRLRPSFPVEVRAFELHFFERNSVNQAAATLGLSRWQCSRGIDKVCKKLSAMLKDWWDDFGGF